MDTIVRIHVFDVMLYILLSGMEINITIVALLFIGPMVSFFYC